MLFFLDGAFCVGLTGVISGVELACACSEGLACPPPPCTARWALYSAQVLLL